MSHFRLASAFATILAIGLPLAAFAPAGQAADPLPRVIFNGDCSFLFGELFVEHKAARYDAQTLHRFIDLLADSGVEAYLCNVNGQVPWYPSRRTGNVLTGYTRGDKEFVRGHFRKGLPPERLDGAIAEHLALLNRFLDLTEAGVDWYAEIIKACRRRGVAPWVSFRMNDMHGSNDWAASYMNAPPQRDSAFRLSGRQPNPRDPVDPSQQPMDYSHAAVRDYMLTVIREAVEDYDVEGVELDWLRCAFCMEPPANREHIETMTRWTAEVRTITDAKARQTGRPCRLGLRVPVRLRQVKEIGLDVRAMAEAGLIDFVNVSNYWQTTWDVPYEQLREDLGPRVALYGVVEAAPNWMQARDPQTGRTGQRMLPTSPELIRGNAAGKLALGVHGIEFFNFFAADEAHHNPDFRRRDAKYAAIRGTGDLDGLRGRPKQYSLATAGGLYVFPVWEYAEQLPMVIEPDDRKSFRLSMCAEPADMDLVVQVTIERSNAAAPALGLSINGSWPSFAGTETDLLVLPTGRYTHHVPEHRALEYRLSADVIREGWNEVLITNGSHAKGTPAEHAVRVVGLDLAVVKRQ